MLTHAEKHAALMDTWSLRETPEVPFSIEIGHHHLATQKFYDDDEAELRWNEQFHHDRAEVDDYAMPNIKPNVGIDIIAAAFGCETTVNNEADPWITSLIREENAGDVYRLKKPNFATNPIFQKMAARLDYFQTHSDWPLRLCNVPSPLVTASLIWDYTSFIEATVLYPKEVHALLDIVTETTIEYVHWQLERIRRLYTMSHEMLYVPREIGLRISDDTAAVMSPKLYREFGVRYNARLSEAFDGIVVHSCGDVQHVVPVMMETPGLRGLDLTITQVTKWERVRDAAAGKTALNLRHFFWDHAGESADLLEYSKRLVAFFGRRGIFLQMSTRTKEEAVTLGQRLHQALS